MNHVKSISYIIALLLVLSATSAVADRFRIRDCPDNALVDLNWAVRFIDRHLDSILNQQSILNTRYQASIKDDWPGTTIDCAKPSRNSCEDGANAFHAGANIVHLCWENMVDDSWRDRCDIVGTILHEKAHEARSPDAGAHNERTPEAENDPVYQFGESVRTYCDNVAAAAAAGTFDRLGQEHLGTVADLPPGDYCDEDEQCQSNECRRGKCVPVGLPLGAECDRNRQCLSDQCRRGKCVCNDDGDCPSGYRCKTAGLNECIKIDGEIGEVCNKNSDCITGKCGRDMCVCDTDQHCIDFLSTRGHGTNWRCRKIGQNECVETSLPDGVRCHVDGDCASGQCRGAGDGRTCHPTGLPNGARCDRNGDCASGQCRGIGSRRTCR